MDLLELQKAIIAAAELDVYDGTGRIFVADLMEKHGVSRDEVLQALNGLQYHTRIHGENIVLVYFIPLDQKLKERRTELLEP